MDLEIAETEENREATDTLAHAQTRKYIETAAKRHNGAESKYVHVYIYVYSD